MHFELGSSYSFQLALIRHGFAPLIQALGVYNRSSKLGSVKPRGA